MPGTTCFVMTATTFTKSGDLDEDAFRRFLHPIIEARIGLYLGSGGCGEGHALSKDDLWRVYRIGVEECKGKVPAHANLPEQFTARETIEHAKLAISAGVDVVHLYTLEGRHGMRPTDEEILGYADDVLSEIQYPVALAVNGPIVGYVPKAEVVARIARKHTQIVEIRMSSLGDTLTNPNNTYMLELKSMINRDIAYNVQLPGSLNALTTGATGVFGTKANIIPKTFRRYVDLYDMKKLDEIGAVYADLMRFNRAVQKWTPFGSPRWLKMAMRVLKLPGGDGGVRRPYLMPEIEVIRNFTDGLLTLDIPELNDLIRAAGLRS